ncbi:unnamed protein product, partial [Prunus brigantina]
IATSRSFLNCLLTCHFIMAYPGSFVLWPSVGTPLPVFDSISWGQSWNVYFRYYHGFLISFQCLASLSSDTSPSRRAS